MSNDNTKRPVLVVGIGNDFRSDDGAGLYVSRRLEQSGLNNICFIHGISDGTSLLDLWTGKQTVYLIDSVSSGKEAGYLYEFNGLADNIPEDYFTAYSTHSFSISETIALGKALGQLPDELIVYGIEGVDFNPGNKISEPVRITADRLIENITANLK